MTSEDIQTSAVTRQKHTYRWLFLSVIVALVLLTLYFGKALFSKEDVGKEAIQSEKNAGNSRKRGFGKDAGVVAVVAKEVSVGDMPVYLNALGTVTGVTATIKPRVDGELIRILYKEGSYVHEGDVLAEIDPRPYQIQLIQVEGQLLRDQALLKNAQLDLERYNTLLQQDSIAAQQTATQAFLVKQYEGTVATDKALVANAKLQLTYTKIIAPISGRLGLRVVDQGNIVKATDTNGIAVITQTQPIAVVFTLPEDQLPALIKQTGGNNLLVEAYDRSGKQKLAVGRLSAIDNQIDINTGTVKLKAQFINDDNALFANQFVNIKLKVDVLRNVTIVPSMVVQTGNSGTFAYIINDGKKVSVQPIKLGPTEGEQVVILEGLEAHQMVVAEGADKLREGSEIKLIERNVAADSHPNNANELNDGRKKQPGKSHKPKG
ncbi:MAG: MdtA/MuxA family multidrug efflux RND transporter periplasmic adaptor subunit [Methylococcaceae bacterium]|jgi:multidrug efflux system membrane fusion protein